MAALEPSIVARSSGVVAVEKPAGLATQAPPGIPSLESWLRSRAGAAGAYLGVPHRLDRAVSGIMLFAESPRAARQLSRQFERRQIVKRYLAIVTAGAGDPLSGDVWEDHLAKVADEARVETVPEAAPGARRAVTRVAGVVGLGTDRLLLVLEPFTGRMHQLRVQAAARGHAVVGDTLYGGPAPPIVAAGDDPRSQPILLHAWEIAWRDPDTGARRLARAALPAHWQCHGGLDGRLADFVRAQGSGSQPP